MKPRSLWQRIGPVLGLVALAGLFAWRVGTSSFSHFPSEAAPDKALKVQFGPYSPASGYFIYVPDALPGASDDRTLFAKVVWGEGDWVRLAADGQSLQRMRGEEALGTLVAAGAPMGRAKVYHDTVTGTLAYTLDFGDWDTCPQLLRPGAEPVTLDCPAIGQVTGPALQRHAGDLARSRMFFRLTRLSSVNSFLGSISLRLDAEVLLREESGGRETRFQAHYFLAPDGQYQLSEFVPITDR